MCGPVQVAAVVVTLWFSSHLVYVVERGYRGALHTAWTARHGRPNYSLVLPPARMLQLHTMKKRQV